MLCKAGLFCKLLLVLLGMSSNYFNGSNATEHNVNLNGNADDNNNAGNSNGVVQIPTKIDKTYDT